MKNSDWVVSESLSYKPSNKNVIPTITEAIFRIVEEVRRVPSFAHLGMNLLGLPMGDTIPWQYNEKFHHLLRAIKDNRLAIVRCASERGLELVIVGANGRPAICGQEPTGFALRCSGAGREDAVKQDKLLRGRQTNNIKRLEAAEVINSHQAALRREAITVLERAFSAVLDSDGRVNGNQTQAIQVVR